MPRPRAARGLPLLLLAVLLSPAALADDTPEPVLAKVPSRCQAVFKGPSGPCQLSGTWVASAVGRTAPKAGRLATDRLEALLVAVMAERLAHAEGVDMLEHAAEQAAACVAQARAEVHLSCGEEEGLLEQRTCLATFPDRSCWGGGALETFGTSWRAMEKGKDSVCREVERQLSEEEAPAEELSRCRRACIEEARATCH